jgi:hypothetical protein
MIVRRTDFDLLLITQPDHAALAGRIMEAWRADGLPDRPTRAAVLGATHVHDLGWTPLDAEPRVDPDSGAPYEFTNAPLADRQELWPRAIDEIAPQDPYVAALVAQHALTVYRRFAPTPGWEEFFPAMEQIRDDLFTSLIVRSAERSEFGGDFPGLDQFLQDYALVGLGDLFSLIFCNGWTDPYLQESYQAILQGETLTISPDPFDGATVPLAVPARRVPARRYVSDADLRDTLASAPIVHLTGTAVGAPTGTGALPIS